MQGYNLLILTDHRVHSAENSIYALVQALLRDPACGRIDIASRGVARNERFFIHQQTDTLYVSTADHHFMYHPQGFFFNRQLHRVSLRDYDVLLLRLPHPTPVTFWDFLADRFPPQQTINNPLGIKQTNSKAFLLNFASVCPPMQLCESIEEIEQLARQFPIVLKPLRDYGGKGIVKIDGSFVWEGNQKIPMRKFQQQFRAHPQPYLAMKFLKNVHQGDKRVIVIGDQIVGASLRLPAKNSWICNVSQGGTSNTTDVTERERIIMQTIHPTLKKAGILYYGFDTLVDDDGQRVLSEINTTSIGGLPQIRRMTGRDVVAELAQLVWQLVDKAVENESS